MFHVEHIHNSKAFLEKFIHGAKCLGFYFSEETLNKFWLHYLELCRWNRSVNLTGLQTEEERTVLLFVDSLAGSLAFSENQGGLILDIGSGGGFPGIPLKLAFPTLQVLLMEPKANKTAFLHNVIGKLHLKHISVLQSRMEDDRLFGPDEEKCDLALTKGVNFVTILPFVKKILKKDGKLVVFRSQKIDNPDTFQGMDLCDEISYDLPYGFGTRVLSIMKYSP